MVSCSKKLRPLCFTNVADGSEAKISYKAEGLDNIKIQYSTNGKKWNNWDNGREITIPDGKKLYVRNTEGKLSDETNKFNFVMSGGSIAASGNVNSMINYQKISDYCFSNMFAGCTLLTTAPDLPATTLFEGCYQMMFQDCSSLTTAPKLLAPNLTKNCYNNMFLNCSALNISEKEGSHLICDFKPSMAFPEGSVQDMFKNCDTQIKQVEHEKYFYN